MLAACARAGSESATGAAAGPSPGTAGAARIDRKRSPAVGRGGSTVVQRRWCRAGGRAAATRRRCLARRVAPGCAVRPGQSVPEGGAQGARKRRRRVGTAAARTGQGELSQRAAGASRPVGRQIQPGTGVAPGAGSGSGRHRRSADPHRRARGHDDAGVHARAAMSLAALSRLRRALARLPCGARLGWAVFTEYRTYVLLLPVEVCANYAELAATLDRIDGTMAWAGGSQISKGLMSALRISARIPEHPAIVFFTDGHEAPPLRGDF